MWILLTAQDSLRKQDTDGDQQKLLWIVWETKRAHTRSRLTDKVLILLD